MSDINTATAPLAEQKIYKTKFCFAVIPVLISLSLSLLSISINIIMNIAYNLWSGDRGIFTVASSIISILCLLTFTVILFIKRPNILVPVSYGATYFLPTLVSIIGNFIFSQREGWEYTIGIQFIINLILEIIAVGTCVLFVLKSPAIKAFMKKTAVIWYIAVPLTTLTVKTIFYIFNFNFDLLAENPEYFIDIAVSFFDNLLVAAILFLLYRWLANPYKEVKPTPQKPASVPQYTQPAVPSQPVQMPAATSVQVAPPVVTSAVQPPVVTPPVVTPARNQSPTTVADEIAKYKALLDTGAITPEEFEALKTKLINKI